jgi:hypothetical protein
VASHLNLIFHSDSAFKIGALQLKVLKTLWDYPKKNALLIKQKRFIEIKNGEVIRHGKVGEDEQFYDISNLQENTEIRALILRFWAKEQVVFLDNTQQTTPHI